MTYVPTRSQGKAGLAATAAFLIFTITATIYTAPFYLPPMGPLNRVLSWVLLALMIIPMALACVGNRQAPSSRDRFHDWLPFAILIYGVLVGTSAVLATPDELKNLVQAVGLPWAISTFTIALPRLFTRTHYQTLSVALTLFFGVLASLALAIQWLQPQFLHAWPEFSRNHRGSNNPTLSLFAHHTVSAHFFQWLPAVGLMARDRLTSRTSRILLMLAITSCGVFALTCGSRQGALFVALSLSPYLLLLIARAPIFALALVPLAFILIAWGGHFAVAAFRADGTNLTGRPAFWRAAWDLWAIDGNYWSGIGIRPRVIGLSLPHNSALTHLLAFGIPGLLAFLMLLGITLGRVKQALSTWTTDTAALAICLVGLLLESGIEDFFIRPYSGAFLAFWYLAGYAMHLGAIKGQPSPQLPGTLPLRHQEL